MDLRFLGAAGTVTGSKYLVASGSCRLLVDCGLFQGYKQLRLRNWSAPPFDVTRLNAVVLTHAHLDHSGYLPLLIKKGFDGPIYCTAATAELCGILLPDSGRLQEEDAERANRHRYSRHSPALPLYTEADAQHALEKLVPRPYEHEFEAAPGLRVTLSQAGHILGSALVRISDGISSLVFSGDLGRPGDLIMRPPTIVKQADYLVIESTYGDRRHDPVEPPKPLGEVIRRTVERGGVIVVPSFAVGRAQSLLYCIHLLKQERFLEADLRVYLNSPMAADVTAIYHEYWREHRLDPAQCTAMCHAARIVNTVEESKRLNERQGPMVIIAGSGMATGGRVVHHIKAFAPDRRNTILFTGFQAGGTRGAAMLAGAGAVKIHGEYVPVRAEVAVLNNLSAHADYAEILDWLRHFDVPPKRTFITHGEPAAADALRLRIQEQLRWDCHVPEYLEQVSLDQASGV